MIRSSTLPWCAMVPLKQMSRLAPLRLDSTVVGLLDGERLYLRGNDSQPDHKDRLLSRPPATVCACPEVELYVLRADGGLMRPGGDVSYGRLPAGQWHRLDHWITVGRPVAANAGRRMRVDRPVLTLVRSSMSVVPAGAMVCRWSKWCQWVDSASVIRLERLSFARMADDRWFGSGLDTLVYGVPLPPINGLQLIDHAGLLIPSGLQWSVIADPVVIRSQLPLSEDDLALFNAAGRWCVLPAQQLLRATRMAVRLADRSLCEGEGGGDD